MLTGAGDRGVALLETTVALLLALAITTAALSLLNPHHLAVQAADEAMDMAQRVRAGIDVLARDVAMAGAGVDAGSRRGSLARLFAPVLPRKVGRWGDSPATARADAISLCYVPITYVQTTTAVAVAGPSSLTVKSVSSCAAGEPACGLQVGMTAILFDDTGAHDLFRVIAVEGETVQVEPHAPLAHAYPPGSTVAQAASRTYYFDAAARQLRKYDGYMSDAPVADNVVGVAFEYLAEGLVPLPLESLADGPWKGAGDGQFDTDLLRVRAIRVTLRVQAGLPAFRGTGPAFRHPGISRSSTRALSDLVVRTVVVPVNLGGGW